MTTIMLKSYGSLTIFVILYTIYMMYGHRQFLYPYFWRTYWYTIMFSLPLMWSIIMIPYTNSVLTIMLGWAFIVLFATFLVLVVLSANLDPVKFKEKLNSRNISILLTGLIGLELFIVMIIELWSRIFK